MIIESTRTIRRRARVASVEEHRKKFPKDRIESVDDRGFDGICENCSVVLLDGDEYTMTTDDCYLCPKCTPTPEEAREQNGLDAYMWSRIDDKAAKAAKVFAEWDNMSDENVRLALAARPKPPNPPMTGEDIRDLRGAIEANWVNTADVCDLAHFLDGLTALAMWIDGGGA